MAGRSRNRVEEGAAAAIAVAASLGLTADEAEILQDSNRVVLLLQPCATVARVVEAGEAEPLGRELELVERLLTHGAPVAEPDLRFERRVFSEDRYVMSFWRYYEPVESRAIDPAQYGARLKSLHEAMATLGMQAPHFTERVARAERFASDPQETPALTDVDRGFLVDELRRSLDAVASSGARDQLLYGEPHSDNVLRTPDGVLFIDFEACCRGPVEFDVADVPKEVADHYPGIDRPLLDECRKLVLAMVSTWCWAGFDKHENLRRAAPQLLGELRSAAARGDT